MFLSGPQATMGSDFGRWKLTRVLFGLQATMGLDFGRWKLTRVLFGLQATMGSDFGRWKLTRVLFGLQTTLGSKNRSTILVKKTGQQYWSKKTGQTLLGGFMFTYHYY